jgi:two-component system response regulator HydG
MIESLLIPPKTVRVLVVDNDRDLARAMTESLERIGFECTTATSGTEGSQLIQQNSYEVIVTDLVMNDIDGMQILKLAKSTLEDCEVIMVTGHATVPLAVDAMREGAFNFLEKPVTPKRLQAVAVKAAEAVKLRRQNEELQSRLDEKFGFENLIFASDSMKGVVDRLRRIAPSDAGVLITGETGTGKEVIAQAIHQNSPRKKKPFVAINAAVTEHLVESELFGHVKGAFTDAISDRPGKFEYADGGTLFLDEVGDMPMSTQIKLLRVLEEREITRVGDNKPIKVNVRVLAATNKDLQKEVAAGRFREDLLYRLNVVTVHLDPLSKRRSDIMPLADHFRKLAAKKNNKQVKGFSPELRKWMIEYSWRGNVRQLRNVVESLVVMDLDGILGIDDLSPELVEESNSASESTSAAKVISALPSLPGPAETEPTAVTNPLREPPSKLLVKELPEEHLVGKTMAEIERWAIEKTLSDKDNNREETALALGISERNLYRKLKEYQLVDEFEGEWASGKRPKWTDFLPKVISSKAKSSVQEEETVKLARLLFPIELKHRQSRGEQIDSERDYPGVSEKTRKALEEILHPPTASEAPPETNRRNPR